MAFLVLCACGGCGGDSGLSPTQPETPRATSITLSPSSVSLTVFGETAQVTATVKDQNGTKLAGATVFALSTGWWGLVGGGFGTLLGV